MLTEAPWAGGRGDRGLLGFGCGQLTAGGPVCWQKTRQKLEIRQARGKSFSFGEMEGLQIFNIETRWFIHVRQKKKPQMNSIAINITPGFQLLRVAAKYSEIQNKLKEQYFTQQIFTKSIQDTHHQEKRKTISVFSNSLRA